MADLTDEEIAKVKAAFAEAQGRPVRLLDPLPRRTRIRLARLRAVNRAGAWLVDRGFFRTADWLWRMLR